MPVSRYIAFDVDGVLIDTDLLHEIAFSDALTTITGTGLTHAEHLGGYKGLPTRVKLQRLMDAGRLTRHQADAVALHKQAATVRALHDVPVDPRKVTLLRALRDRGDHVCAVSNAVAETVEAMLDRVGVLGLVQFWLCNEDVTPKPDPALYRLAAQRFGVPAADVIVVEDSTPGILAATRAGCRVVAVRGPEDVTLDLLRRIDEVGA